MADPFRLIPLVLLLSACAAAPASDPAERADADIGPYTPAQVLRRIADVEAGHVDPELRKLSYQGRLAYLLNSPCCDRFNYLYDAGGRILCAPSGGLTGRGDGRCTAPLLEPAASATRLKAL